MVVLAIFFDKSFRTVEEIEHLLGVTVIGTLPLIQDEHFERKRRLRVLRWVTIIAAIMLFLFNLVGLPTYPGLYDKFLIAVGLIFNAVTIWYAWKWVTP